MSSGTPLARGLSIWISVFAFIASAATAAEDRSWIERSDRNTAMVFETLGAFYPEWMASLGIEKFDTAVVDLKPDRVKRVDAALAAQITRVKALKAKGNDIIVFHIMDNFELTFPFEDMAQFEDMETKKKLHVIPEYLRKQYLVILNEHMAQYRQRGAAGNGVSYRLNGFIQFFPRTYRL